MVCVRCVGLCGVGKVVCGGLGRVGRVGRLVCCGVCRMGWVA